MLVTGGLQAQDIKGEWVLDKVRIKTYNKVNNTLLEDRFTDSLPSRTDRVVLKPRLTIGERDFMMQGDYIIAGTYSLIGDRISFNDFNTVVQNDPAEEEKRRVFLTYKMPDAENLHIEWPVSVYRHEGTLIKKIVICQYKRKK